MGFRSENVFRKQMNIEGENAKLVRSLVFAFIEYLFTGCSAFCFQH